MFCCYSNAFLYPSSIFYSKTFEVNCILQKCAQITSEQINKFSQSVNCIIITQIKKLDMSITTKNGVISAASNNFSSKITNSNFGYSQV